MTTDDLKKIIDIIGKDKEHIHFVDRIKKDFQENQTKGIPVAMKVFFAKSQDKVVGFAIISISPLKMRQWEETFLEEGWAEKNFKIDISSFELMYLYVRPEFRRIRKGTELFNKIMAYTRRVGIKKIYAYVSDRKGIALRFYKKNKAQVIYDFSSEEDSISTAYLMWEA